MRHMWRLHKPKAVLTGAKNFVVIHALCWSQCKVVYTHHRANHAADGFGMRCNFEPLVERATLIRLKMTEANPSYSRRVNHTCNRLVHKRKDRLHSGVE